MLSSRSWTGLTILVLAALALFLGVHAGRRAWQNEVYDFRAYYSAATEMRAGRDPYQLTPKPYLYPPLFAVGCIPLTSLSRSHAALVYLPLLLAAVLLSLYLAPKVMLERFDVQSNPAVLGQTILITLVVMFDRLKADTQMFQVNTLMLLLFTLGLHWLDRKPWLSGSALGLALNIKGQSILMLPYLLFRKRWSAASAMAGSAVGFALLPGAAIGWDNNLRFLGYLFGGLRALTGTQAPVHSTSHLADASSHISVSVTSGIARMLKFAGYSQWLWPVVGVIIAVLATLVWLAYRRSGLPVWRWPDCQEQNRQPWRALIAVEWSCLILATLIFNPQSNTRHFVLTLLPLAMALAALRIRAPRRSWWLMLTGAAVLFAALTLPPGKQSVPLLVQLVAQWKFIGGPGWLLLASTGLLLLAGLQLRGSAETDAKTEETSCTSVP